jgi:hypothetical protein
VPVAVAPYIALFISIASNLFTLELPTWYSAGGTMCSSSSYRADDTVSGNLALSVSGDTLLLRVSVDPVEART